MAVQAPVTSIATAFGKHLRAEPGTQFAPVGSKAVPSGSYTVELAFTLPEARAFREKVLYAALIACGHSKYVQPIRPLVNSMARVPDSRSSRRRTEQPFRSPPLRRNPQLRRSFANALVRPLSAST